MKTGNTYQKKLAAALKIPMPQWSPVMKTGNTTISNDTRAKIVAPQWSPVMKTGNTDAAPERPGPGVGPQWSPVMKTGNTPGKGVES